MYGARPYLTVLVLVSTLIGHGAAAVPRGDADGDGDIDGDDLIAVQTEFGNTGATPLLGDADCDGDVDTDDLFVVSTNIDPVGVIDGAAATFDFRDPDLDETFDVYFEVTGSAGLAIYYLRLESLSATTLDPGAIAWEQAALANYELESPPFSSRGFSVTPFAGPENDRFVAYGSQWSTQWDSLNTAYGVGVEEVEIPGDLDVTIGVPALLGQLTIPGFYDLTEAEALALLQPTAALFDSEFSSSAVGLPESVEVLVSGPTILKGDADGDGDIDGDDLIAVQTNFGATSDGSFLLLGDADCDGDVDGDDLIFLQSNFGNVLAVSSAAPEPAAGVMVALALLSAIRSRGQAR